MRRIRNLRRARGVTSAVLRRWPPLWRSPDAAAERTSRQDDVVLDRRKRRRARRNCSTLPADQMSHIQIYTVAAGAHGAHAAALRRGRVQRLPDHAGDHAGRGPGQPHPGHARRASDARASRCCTSPAPTIRRCGRHTSRRATPSSSPTRSYKRAQDLYAHKAIAAGRPRAGRIDARAGAGRSAIQRTGHPHPGNHESGRSGQQAAVAGSGAAGARGGRSRRAALLAGATAAGRRNAMLHDFGHEHRVGARQRLSERSRVRARRR